MTYEFIESPNKSSRMGNQVGGIIVHSTISGSLNSTVRYMCNRIKVPDYLLNKNQKGYVVVNGVTYYNARCSAHYITGQTGRTIRLVPENMAAWHAGSKTTNPQLNGRDSVNLWTIGHELVNWGPLRKVGDRFYSSPGYWTNLYDGPQPVHKPYDLNQKLGKTYVLENGGLVFPERIIEYWAPFTEEQIKATIILWSEIVDRYNINKDFVAGHEDIDPTRKSDPGAVFPWNSIYQEVFGQQKPPPYELLEETEPQEDPVTGNIAEDIKIAEQAFSDDRSKSSLCNPFLNIFRP